MLHQDMNPVVFPDTAGTVAWTTVVSNYTQAAAPPGLSHHRPPFPQSLNSQLDGQRPPAGDENS